MDVSAEDVRHVARLIRMEVGDDEIEPLRRHFSSILEHFQTLQEVDLQAVHPFALDRSAASPMREDEPQRWPERDRALQEAPMRDGDFFKVPRIVKEED
ncbi:MAG: Asp-tRNA(Asn)/Glu-tRNA(Gln) amidotransferase subunit GatC [Synergistales bacterium]|nr:Asp-tRNA(Asn)/Glu-tRNA(Gln) amidotransferase subunit GatC [Synergistales bacterium]